MDLAGNVCTRALNMVDMVEHQLCPVVQSPISANPGLALLGYINC